MGHLTTLVIGDDFLGQLDKHRRGAEHINPYFVDTDLLPGIRRRSGPLPGSDNVALRRWIENQGVPVLDPGQAPPDLVDSMCGDWARRARWARIDAAGVVRELVERTIAYGFHDYFSCTLDLLVLKPGASGENIGRSTGDLEVVTGGAAGRARRRDIDFAAMVGPLQAEAAAWWDRAHAACAGRTWKTWGEIRGNYKSPTHWQALSREATAKWRAQPAVAAIIEATKEGKPSYMTLSHYEVTPEPSSWNNDVERTIDRMRMPRADYIGHFGVSWVTRCSYLVVNGTLFDDPSEAVVSAQLDAVPDDAWVTVAHVHA